jgi:hypothetical protein
MAPVAEFGDAPDTTQSFAFGDGRGQASAYWSTSDGVEVVSLLYETPCLIAATAAGDQLPIRPIVPGGWNKPKPETFV